MKFTEMSAQKGGEVHQMQQRTVNGAIAQPELLTRIFSRTGPDNPGRLPLSPAHQGPVWLKRVTGGVRAFLLALDQAGQRHWEQVRRTPFFLM